MTVGLERAPAKIAGRDEGLMVVVFGRLDLREITMLGDIAKGSEGLRLGPTFPALAGKCKGLKDESVCVHASVGDAPSLLQEAA